MYLPIHKVRNDLHWHNSSISGQSVNIFDTNTVLFLRWDVYESYHFHDTQGVSNIKTSEANQVFEPIEHTAKSSIVFTEML